MITADNLSPFKIWVIIVWHKSSFSITKEGKLSFYVDDSKNGYANEQASTGEENNVNISLNESVPVLDSNVMW